MIECSCACDSGDSEGIFDTASSAVREYYTCSECGETIWPWEEHLVGYWWDCSACDDWDDDLDNDCGAEDGYCKKEGREPDSESHMCKACDNACDSLLCGCWWIGEVWARIAERNEMTLAECLNGSDKDEEP